MMSESKKKLFLFDAMALIYRAHFAFRKNPRINSKGLNTGAIFGFVNTIWEIIRKEKPTHLGVAFDTPEPTFRHKHFEAYKANREAQPEEIQIALPKIKEIIRAFGIPLLQKSGFEADDVIGTLAKRAESEDFEVFMMTSDKDYGQLVSTHIFLYKPAFLGKGVEVMGIPEVLAKWGIEEVGQLTDVLGLQGDAVDNIPGVPGIGPKTASKLLLKYKSVENLIAHAHELRGKQREKVETFAQQAILSKTLATIRTDVPLDFDAQALRYEGFDQEKLAPLFQELEFKTLARRILGENQPKSGQSAAGQSGQTSLFDDFPAKKLSPPEFSEPPLQSIDSRTHRYYHLRTAQARKSLCHFLSLQQAFCLDTETTSTDADTAALVGVSFAYQAGEAFYVPIPADEAEAKQILADFLPVFSDERIAKIGQNLKYDLKVLQNYGISLKGPLYDTMIAHYLLFPEQRHNMDAMARRLLNYAALPIESLIGKKGKKQGNMRHVCPEKVAEYAGEDADITFCLWQILAEKIEKQALSSLFHHIEMPLLGVLMQMEQNGVKVDTAFLTSYSKTLAGKIEKIENKIYQEAGVEFNINSPKQLGEILFGKLVLSKNPKKTKTGQYATSEDVLLSLSADAQIVRNILDYRQLQKLKSTYVDALPKLISPKDGRIHTSYNQSVAVTGRLSSTQPNLQNIPIRTAEGREIRKSFVARSADYLLLSADYSQVELRIMAAFSKDPTMLQAFAQGRDIHATTAAKIFKVPLEAVDSEMRRRAKTANFGIIYGVSAYGLSQQLQIPREEAKKIIDAYFEEFSTIKKYTEDMIQFARTHGYVETLMKRRRYLPNIKSRNFTQRSFDERNAVNTPIQGSAADIIKKAMVSIGEWLKKEQLRTKMIMQVHDELVFDVHKSELDYVQKKVVALMESAAAPDVPLKVDIGQGHNWLEAH